ncbi:unnamed protein product [Colias eurytheme]|nr:unnamed protein product [Colias eurytheme]
MLLIWLIVVIVTKEYVSGVTTNVWKESANVQTSLKQKTNIHRTPCRKYLKSSTKEGSTLSPFEPRISETIFPETIYPISILDSTQPYYFLSEFRDSITGPFENDVKQSYNYLFSKSNECQQDTCSYFVDNCMKNTRYNSKNPKSKNMNPIIGKNYSKETQECEEKSYKNYSSLLNEKLNKYPESSLPLTINVNIEVLKNDIAARNDVSYDISDFVDENRSDDDISGDGTHEITDSMSYNFPLIEETINIGEMPQYDEQIVPPPLYNYTEFENTATSYIISEDESEKIYCNNAICINSVNLNDAILENDDCIRVSSESAFLNYNNIDLSTESAVTSCPDY